MEWALADEAANGFSARMLIAYSEDPELDDDTPRGGTALAALRKVRSRIEAYRSRLDSEVEYKENLFSPKPRRPIKLSAEALDTLKIIYNRTKLKPKWDVHLSEAGNRAGGFERVLPPLIARSSDSAV